MTNQSKVALLQSETRTIAKWGKQFTRKWCSIAKWNRYDKVGQLLRGTAVQRSKQSVKLEIKLNLEIKVVGQKILLPFLVPHICLLGTRTNGGTRMQIGPVWFESRVL